MTNSKNKGTENNTIPQNQPELQSDSINTEVRANDTANEYRWFKIYRPTAQPLFMKQIYNFTNQFRTDISKEWVKNFDIYTFTNNQTTKDGEVKLPKGIWHFTIKFGYNIVMKNGVQINTWAFHSLDFNFKAYLNGVEQNDRERLVCNQAPQNARVDYDFYINNDTDNALLKFTFTPTCIKYGEKGDYQDLNDLVKVELENISLIGETKVDKGA